MSDEPKPGRKRIRRLSRFLCREMLYDFASLRLDAERQRAVEEFLKNNEEQVQELGELKQAMDYCQDLSGTTVSQPLLEEFKLFHSPLSQFTQRLAWSQWPEFLRWGTEALVISAVVAAAGITIPWEKVRTLLPESQKKYVLAERAKKKAQERVAKTEALGARSPAAIEEAEKTKNTVLAQAEIKTPLKPIPTGTLPLEEPAPKREVAAAKPEPVKPPPPPPEEPKPQIKVEPAAPAAVVTVKAGTKEQALKGVLFRATMTNSNVDSVSPLMKTEIEKLGGLKAGQVELGWKQSGNSRYFHFTLPEANYEELLKSLRYFGPVRISKEPHWRVMPQGQIRIILSLEDAKK